MRHTIHKGFFARCSFWALILCVATPAFGTEKGEIEIGFGQSTNAYLGQDEADDRFLSARANAEYGRPLSQQGQFHLGLRGAHRHFISETEANRSRARLSSAYQRRLSEGVASQALYVQHQVAPNFLRQRLTSYSIYTASQFETQFRASDLILSLPVEAQFYRQPTQRRSAPPDMFEATYKEDHYKVGMEAAWRLYVDRALHNSVLIGVSSKGQFFTDKPASTKDGGLGTAQGGKGTGTKARTMLSRARISYQTISQRWRLEPAAALGYNHDLNRGSEAYVSYLLELAGHYRSRLMEVQWLGSYEHTDYLHKRTNLGNQPTSSTLQLTNLKYNFRTLYRFTTQLATGGGLRYRRFASSFAEDSFEVREFYGLVNFQF